MIQFDEVAPLYCQHDSGKDIELDNVILIVDHDQIETDGAPLGTNDCATSNRNSSSQMLLI